MNEENNNTEDKIRKELEKNNANITTDSNIDSLNQDDSINTIQAQ